MIDKSKGKRINITISYELDETLNYLAKRYGTTKSALCTMMIGQSAFAQKEALDTLVNKLGDSLIESLKDSSK